MDADAFKKYIGPLLKEQGFRKSNASWRKNQGESIAVFNVQKSSWDGDRFYINIGVYFRALGDEKFPMENRCHVQVRLYEDDLPAIFPAAIDWFAARASIESAVKLTESDSKKGLVLKELRNWRIT